MVYRQSDTYSLHIKDAKTGWSDNYYEYTLADTHDYKAVVTSCELPTEITEGATIKAGIHNIVALIYTALNGFAFNVVLPLFYLLITLGILE